MQTLQRAAGRWSGLASLALLVAIAASAGVFDPVLKELLLLVQGRVDQIDGWANQIELNDKAFLAMFPVIFAVIALELFFTIAAVCVQRLILGKSGKHALRDLFSRLGNGRNFYRIFKAVTIEELLARGLFLGLLTQIPFLSGTTAFYVLFVIGNSVWALYHLPNFLDPEDRHVLRVLPQFIAGVFFTYIFVKYGLLASILTHFASNAILFSLNKVQKTTGTDVLQTIYAGVVAAACYFLMTKPLSDIQMWFLDSHGFVIPGWQFWDYVVLSLFVDWSLILLFDLLLYDRANLTKKEQERGLGFIGRSITMAIIVCLFYGMFWVLGLVVSNVPYRILILAILFAFVSTGASGSAVSRTFWTSVPGLYISICVLQALGFWFSICYLLFSSVVSWPWMQLCRVKEENRVVLR